MMVGLMSALSCGLGCGCSLSGKGEMYVKN